MTLGPQYPLAWMSVRLKRTERLSPVRAINDAYKAAQDDTPGYDVEVALGRAVEARNGLANMVAILDETVLPLLWERGARAEARVRGVGRGDA